MKIKSLYQGKKEFYTDPVNGRFNKIRLCTMFFIVTLYFLTPWINYGGHQIFLFDVFYNRIYLFGSTFFPQDFVLIALFLIFFIILLFAVTLYSGRIWCGFLCPQSIWIKMAAFITRFFEGKRNSRIKFNLMSMSINKFSFLLLKHIGWLFLSFITGFTFISYFVPLNFLFTSLLTFDFFYKSFFWILFFTFLTYFNIGWFREQFCFLVCPYARLQSVMFDQNTLIVSYDSKRGEKRGARNKKFDYKSHGLGDCIDCKRCINCCPTGIDIRDGLQIECISCGACVDACNDVMDKLGYAPDLISFKRENIFNKNYFHSSKIKLFSYTVILILLFSIMIYFFATRPLLHFSVARSQYQLFNITDKNYIENYFILKFLNKTNKETFYLIDVYPNVFEFAGSKEIILKPGEMKVLNVNLLLKNNDFNNSKMIDIVFKVFDSNSNAYIIKKSKFVLPVGNF